MSVTIELEVSFSRLSAEKLNEIGKDFYRHARILGVSEFLNGYFCNAKITEETYDDFKTEFKTDVFPRLTDHAKQILKSCFAAEPKPKEEEEGNRNTGEEEIFYKVGDKFEWCGSIYTLCCFDGNNIGVMIRNSNQYICDTRYSRHIADKYRVTEQELYNITGGRSSEFKKIVEPVDPEFDEVE